MWVSGSPYSKKPKLTFCTTLQHSASQKQHLINLASNSSKAHMMHDSSSPATLAISVRLQQQVIWAKLTKRAKAYSSSDSAVTHHSTNRARRRVASFQSKRVTNYATPPMPVPWRHLVNEIDLHRPKYLKSLMPACAGLHEPMGSGLRLQKSTFNAENFIRRLSQSNSSHFVAIHYWNVRSIQILRKIH